MKNHFLTLITLLVLGTSCETKEDAILSPAKIIAAESLNGIWVLKSTKMSFPSDSKHVTASTNEKYEFDTNTSTYKLYTDEKLVEVGNYTLTMSTNSSNGKMTITFSEDETTATLFFENEMIILGNRVPKGALLIDYDDYRYYSKK